MMAQLASAPMRLYRSIRHPFCHLFTSDDCGYLITDHLHGRSQGQIFTEAKILITSSVWYVAKCTVVYGDLTFCPYIT